MIFSTKQPHLLKLCTFQDSAKWDSGKRVLAQNGIRQNGTEPNVPAYSVETQVPLFGCF